ncbi:hypothetical protein P691DRAFT_762345 [Macrolepiota fuliginosa MF-IS2]|uniref:RlpA-like protein double-psi beta-barrel domain-containing protein n=1 Tax=Macrolepiota fuliginosa MF-IS2 TaxID=1400762 RepID=A0A9P5X938_9AGAR|nr:hypothetical protein P691DRAFT_762345 [Macrolepiota fuliginosa MF-IS2]
MSGTGQGACGDLLNKDMPIAALAGVYFDSYPGSNGNPNQNPLCGKKINVTVGGKSVQVTVKDRCDSCHGSFDVDLSESSFHQVADIAAGRVDGSWDFVDPQDDIGMKPGDIDNVPPPRPTSPHTSDGAAPNGIIATNVPRSSTSPDPESGNRSPSHPRRMSRIMRNLAKDLDRAKRSGTKKSASKGRKSGIRPRRLSRVMRGVVIDDQN